jgi:hypothetical protein
MKAIRRPPPVPVPVPVEIPRCDSIISPSWVAEKMAISRASPRLQARLDSLMFVPDDDDHDDDACDPSRTVYDDEDDNDENGNDNDNDNDDDADKEHDEQASPLPPTRQGEEEEEDNDHHHSKQTRTSTLDEGSCTGYHHQRQLTRDGQLPNQNQNRQPRLTRPAPPHYQLRERKPRSEAIAREPEPWRVAHGLPGAYAMPGTETIVTEEEEEDDENDNHNDEEAHNSNNNEQEGTDGMTDEVTGTLCGGFKRQNIAGMIICVVVVTVAIIVTVVLAVVLSNNRNKNTDCHHSVALTTTAVDETTNEDAGHVRFNKLRPFLEKINSNTSVAWEDPQSPQSQALHWLIYEDLFTETAVNVYGIPDLDRIQTRYLLAVFYFATGGRTEGGGSWRNTFNFISPVLHECDWNSVINSTNGGPSSMEQQGVICDDWFEVTAIILGKFNHNRITICPALCIFLLILPILFHVFFRQTLTQKQRTIGSVVVFP